MQKQNILKMKDNLARNEKNEFLDISIYNNDLWNVKFLFIHNAIHSKFNCNYFKVENNDNIFSLTQKKEQILPSSKKSKTSNLYYHLSHHFIR